MWLLGSKPNANWKIEANHFVAWHLLYLIFSPITSSWAEILAPSAFAGTCRIINVLKNAVARIQTSSANACKVGFHLMKLENPTQHKDCWGQYPGKNIILQESWPKPQCCKGRYTKTNAARTLSDSIVSLAYHCLSLLFTCPASLIFSWGNSFTASTQAKPMKAMPMRGANLEQC